MIYYAHSMKIYDSVAESEEFKFIKDYFKDSDVINPNGDIKWGGTMKPYLAAVERSNMVVMSEYKGHVGRGVYEEALVALEHNIPVRCIRRDKNGQLLVVNINDLRKADRNDWAIKYAKVKEEEKDSKESSGNSTSTSR